MKNPWKDYINEFNKLEANCPDYRYPVDDVETESKLNIQDAGKKKREQLLYIEWLSKEWEIAIDFGCGTGANICCFDTPDNESKMLIGVDPDRERVSLVEKRARGSKFIELVFACADVSILEKAPQGLYVDIILCSQVLGHVRESDIARIIDGFASNLQSGGRCVISVPVVGDSFASDPSSDGWKPGGDFYHYINQSSSPFDKDYRTRVQPDVFDRMAAKCETGFLPVRSFWLPEMSGLDDSNLPVESQSIPSSLSDILNKFFNISKVYLYSAHKTLVETHEPAIGDLLISMTRF